MSDLTSDRLHGSSRPRVSLTASGLLWPLAPYACALAAGEAGLLAGRAMGADAAAFEDKLLLLLRFMAAVKFAGVLVAAGLLHWRFNRPVARRLAAAYGIALAAMAFAAGLIWSLGAIAAGALSFHAGLIGFLILAWRDEGVELPRRR